MTGRIFISYRRSDSQYATDRIYERLGKHFGADRVFMDIDNIPLGVNFRDYIDQQISTSDIVLAVIGDHWLNAADSKGQFRLQNPSDFVRLEIEAALKQSITLIPLFIGGVEALPPDSLPDSMKEISMLNATRIRRGDDFLPDVDRLIRGIEHIDRQQTARREENKAVLLEIEHLATEIISRLSAFEVVLIQEMRKRTQLEKEAQTIAAMAKEHLKDSRKQLRADIVEYKKQIDKLQDNLVKLALQIEARKQGAPVDDDLLFEEPEIPERQEKETPAKTPKPARKRKKLFTNVPNWAWAGGVVVIIALVWGLTSLFSGGTPSAEVDKTNVPAGTNAADTALTPTSTSNSLESAKAAWITSNHDFIFWMSEITKTTPDFIEDFSISQPYWNNYVSERTYRIVDEPSSVTDYVFTLPWDTPSAYLLQFDFTPNEFAYGSHLKVQIGSDGLFRVQSDGTWELSSLSEGLELYSGTIADLNVGHTYLILVCVWEDQIAILIDSQLVTYLEDQPFSPGPFEIVVDSYKPIDVTLDNIEIWDLSHRNYLEIPDQADARSFYTPIREHLSNTPPDFKEDFEQYLPYWDQMRVNLSDTWSVSLAEIALDGILYQSPQAEDHYRNIKLEFPDLHSESFAIQYDFLFSAPGSQDAPKTASIETSWGAADNQEHFIPYCDFYEEISEIYCGLYKTSDSGEIIEVDNQNIQFYKNIDSHYTLLAIFYDGQFVLFLDGFFMGYTDGLDLFDQQIAITMGIADPLAQYEFGVEVDNIQFWNLDSWDPPQQGDGTSSSDLDYEFILEYVQTELPPTFEDDFSTARGEWGATLSDNREITSMIQDEILVAENRQGDLKFPMTGFLNAENFVLSFDFIPGTIEESVNGSIGVEFLASGFSGNQYYKFKISYSALGMGTDAWLFSQADGSGVRTTDNGVVAVKDNDFNRVQILVVQGQLVVVVNDKLVYQDFGLTTWGSDIYFVKGGETNSRLSMDNVTFWNLDGVDLNP